MYSFAEWLNKNHGIIIENLRDQIRGSGEKPAPVDPVKAKAQAEAQKKAARLRTRGEGDRVKYR